MELIKFLMKPAISEEKLNRRNQFIFECFPEVRSLLLEKV